MKTQIYLIGLVLVISAIHSGCKKSNSDPTTDTEIFYSSNASYLPISVYVDGVFKGQITTVYTGLASQLPDCGTNGDVTVTVDGSITHPWYATGANGTSWTKHIDGTPNYIGGSHYVACSGFDLH